MIQIKTAKPVRTSKNMNTSLHQQFMTAAIELAQTSIEHCGGPFGAVIIKDGQIIGRGSNQVTRNNDPTAHAEIEAIRNACRNINRYALTGCTLYASSQPCPMCLSAIYWARIDKVYYANTYEDASKIGFDDAFIFRELRLPDEQKSITLARIKEPDVREKALQVFQSWEQSEFKKPY